MDFLVLFLIYLVCVLTSVLLLCVYSKRTHTTAGEVLTDGSQVFLRFIPGWLQRVTQRTFHHLFHTRNRIFIILNLTLEGAVYGEYTWEIFHYCQELEFSLYHLLLPYLLLIINLFFFILSCTTNPGIITKSNEESFLQIYEYDEVIFLKNMKCPTCNVRKPARSKHCHVCNRCVHRFDHHCIWVNNCIGALNTRYFVIYLLTLTAMAVDIAIITTAFLIHLVLISGMTLGTYVDDQGQEQPVVIAFIIQYLFLTFPRIVFMLGFILVLCLLLAGYVCFTLYLAFTNMTSSEWHKSRRTRCHRCHVSDPVQGKPSAYKNIYTKGAWTNLKEIFKPLIDNGKNK